MEDNIRLSILNGNKEPNGQCVICNRNVYKDNRYLCREHHIEELQATFALISKGVLGVIAHYYPIRDKQGNKYASIGAYIDLET